jgi:sigma-B regulation protein RsbU (phosphoserine phosphatase)
VVRESTDSPLGARALTAALEAMPDGVAIFDSDWTILFINPVASTLVGRPASELVGHNIWVALPELAGTIFHSFLLHARTAGTRMGWQGFCAPAGRWLSATAVVSDDLLHVYFRPTGDRVPELPSAAGILGEPMDWDGANDRDRLRFLAEVSEAMISTLDTGESTAQLASLVVPRLCDWVIVALVGDDGRPGEEAHAHRDPARRADLETYLDGRIRGTGDDTPMVAALLSGEPVQVTTIDPGLVEPSLPTDEIREAWRRLDVSSCTIVPLRARTETLGALALMNTGRRPPHTEMEIATAVEVARRAAVALDNARLYGRQLKVAETLQRSLLTPPPDSDHLGLAVRYVPAATHMHVGGDWYDAFQEVDGATLLVIGDVVGHNVDAAAAMGQIRSILRGIAYERPGSPAETLTRVDRVLNGLHIGSLATVLIARIEQPADQAGHGLRTLRWSSAGHLPPALLCPDGAVHVLGSTPERLLGADPTSPRSDHAAVLGPGDTVVFYTDGIVEHGRTGIDEGIARFTAVLAELSDVPLDELCDELLSRIVRGRTDDDIAILAVRCHPEDVGPSA